MGQAGAALARPEAGQARPLEQLEVGVAACPTAASRSATVVPMQRQTTPASVGGRRQRMRRRPPRRRRSPARRRPSGRGRRAARGRGRRSRCRTAVVDLGAVAGRRSRRPAPARRSSPSNRTSSPAARHETRPAGPDAPRPRSTPPRAALGGAGRQQPGQVVARADRLELGRAGRDDDLVGLDMEHAVAGVRATTSGRRRSPTTSCPSAASRTQDVRADAAGRGCRGARSSRRR